MKQIILSLLAAASICFSTAAMANGDDEGGSPLSGWYLELQGGSWLGDDPSINIPGVANGKYDADDVFTIMAAVGAPIAHNWRAEFNFSVTSGGDGNYFNLPHSGSFEVYTLIGNAIYDFDMGAPIVPFIGLGAGVAIADVNNLGAVGGAFTTNDTDAAFIVNGLVGFNVPITETIALTARYTLGWMDSMSFRNTNGNPNSSQSDQFVHAATGGIRINLN